MTATVPCPGCGDPIRVLLKVNHSTWGNTHVTLNRPIFHFCQETTMNEHADRDGSEEPRRDYGDAIASIVSGAKSEAALTREVERLRAEVERLQRERDGIGCSRFTCADDLGRMRNRAEAAEQDAADWRDKAQESGAAYANANSKHHAEWEHAVDFKDRARAAEAERDRLAGVVERVRAVHAPCSQFPTCVDDDDFCHECSDEYPCLTVRTLDADAPEASEEGHRG